VRGSQGSAAATWSNRPKSTGASSANNDTPRIESAAPRAAVSGLRGWDPCARKRCSLGCEERLCTGAALTYAGEDGHDKEGVGHGDDGGDAGGDHLLERLDSAEEPDHAEDAHHAEDVHGQVDRPQRRQGENDDDEVQDVPAAAEEGPEPIRVEVEEKLDGKDNREEHVEVVEDSGEVGG
jgi:hypothetical protein